MGDYQFWLYVIIGVIYLLSRLLKKPAEKPTDVPDYHPEKPAPRFEPPTAKPTASPSRTLTFEELLREITESKRQTAETVLPREDYVNYDEEVPVEEQDLEDVNYNYKKDKITAEYEDAKQHAFTRSSLEETLRIADTDTRFEKFKVFQAQEQSNPMDRYLSDFYDLEGLKKAVVLNEILKTKF